MVESKKSQTNFKTDWISVLQAGKKRFKTKQENDKETKCCWKFAVFLWKFTNMQRQYIAVWQYFQDDFWNIWEI